MSRLIAIQILAVFVCTGSASASAQSAAINRATQNLGHLDIMQALQGLCPRGELIWSEGEAAGCKQCPAGGLAFVPEWHLEKITLGHFTDPNAKEMLLSGSGCEPHSEYFGGTYLLRRNSVRWALVRYESGLITENCLKLRGADESELLVCRNHDGGQGVGWDFVYLVRFASAGSAIINRVLQLPDDTVGTCGATKTIEVRSSSISKFELVDGDTSSPRLIVTAVLGTRKLSKSDAEACYAVFKNQPTNPYGKLRQMLSVSITEHRLEFSFDGSHFIPTPTTQLIMKSFPEPSAP
jgi:hypothetical protein